MQENYIEVDMNERLNDLDPKELELPETTFVWDMESRVFQSIALESLARIEGIALLEGNLFDALLGREANEHLKGIHVEQEQKKHSVNLKIEINVRYGVCLPEKAEEIQTKISRDVSRLTGMHVGSVHVIFKNVIPAAEASSMALIE